jgi:hypothetical protein
MATKRSTPRKSVAARKRATKAPAKPAAKPATRRATVRRPGAAESTLAGLGKRADDAGARLGALAKSGGRAAGESLESARASATRTIQRAQKSWDHLEPKGKAALVAGGIAALAAAVATPLVAKRKKK